MYKERQNFNRGFWLVNESKNQRIYFTKNAMIKKLVSIKKLDDKQAELQ